MGRAWPLTGRAEELQFIAGAMRRSGEPRGVVLAGAPGVGKSRLAREVLAGAEQRGARGWWVPATLSARRLPLGAFATLVPVGHGDPSQVLAHAVGALVEGAGRGGVVVCVDDAHWLDELSALLVHRLLVRRAATLVLTVRTGEPAPESVTALWKDELLDRLEVQPLSEPETGELLEAGLGGPVEGPAAAGMWALTRGNVLFLRHLVDGELAAGRLHAVRGIWRWSGNPTLSARLTELVEARMGQLSAPVREVVEVLALGEPLDVGLLTRLTDPVAVEQAEAAGLVRVERNQQMLQARLGHPLYGEAQRARLGGLRARRLRGTIACGLADPAVAEPKATLRRALLALDSDLAPDPGLFTAAAQTAILLADLELAERMARAAVAADGGFGARLTLGYALSWLSRGPEADRELAALATMAGDDAQRTQVAIPRAANRFWIILIQRVPKRSCGTRRRRSGIMTRSGSSSRYAPRSTPGWAGRSRP